MLGASLAKIFFVGACYLPICFVRNMCKMQTSSIVLSRSNSVCFRLRKADSYQVYVLLVPLFTMPILAAYVILAFVSLVPLNLVAYRILPSHLIFSLQVLPKFGHPRAKEPPPHLLFTSFAKILGILGQGTLANFLSGQWLAKIGRA